MMSLPGYLKRIFLITVCCVALSGCLGTEVKTLGPATSGIVPADATNSDIFSISLAFRDMVNSPGTVSLQGQFNSPSANLVNVCGTTGTACNCLFYRSGTDASPVTSASIGISAQNNSASCVVPTADVGTTFQYVQLLSNVAANESTALINIATTLTLAQVLGTLPTSAVNGIFSYSCIQTFFEGQGVTPSQVSCTPDQALGIITAEYEFFIFRNQTTSDQPGGDIPFPADICGREDFLKIQCSGNTPILQYGFYNTNSGPFVVNVQMTRAPQAAAGDTNPLTLSYGFAGLPDSAGNCPVGLQAVRPWLAEPASIVQGSLQNATPIFSNPASSFINTGGELNSTIIAATIPAPFVVERQSNSTPCSAAAVGTVAAGDCTLATFNGEYAAETITYTGITPILCAIPSTLLGSLF